MSRGAERRRNREIIRAKKAGKKPPKKKKDNKPSSRGEERRAGAKRSSSNVSKGASSVKRAYDTRRQNNSNSNNTTSSGTQNHRSGGVGSQARTTRSGAISSAANQRREGAGRASGAIAAYQKKNDEAWKKNQEERRKLASKTSATGGRVKTHTQKVGDSAGKNFKQVGVGDISTKGMLAQTATKKKAEADYDKSKKLKKELQDKGYNIPKGKTVREVSPAKGPQLPQYELIDEKKSKKEAVKAAQKKQWVEDTRSNREARKEYNKKNTATLKAKDLTNEDYIRLQNAMRLGSKYGNKALGDDLAKKVGSVMAYEANKNKKAQFVHNLLQGSSYGDIENVIGKYGKAERLALKESKESGAGQAGYMAGLMGAFARSGINGVGQAAGKGVVKGVAKRLGKEVGEEFAGSTAKKWAKQFGTNRLGELIAETPINTLDAAKMAKDENGKIDKKAFATYMALNAGMTLGGGGAIDIPGSAITKRRANTYMKLKAKEAAGSLTRAEQATLDTVTKKLNDTARNANAPSSALAKGTDKQFKAAADKAAGKIAQAGPKTSTIENRLARKLKDRGMSDKEIRKVVKGSDVQKYVASISKASTQDTGPVGIAQNALTRPELGQYAYLKKRQSVGALSKEEARQLQPLEAKVTEAKVVADDTMRAITEEVEANVGKATAKDVVTAKHCVNYFESVGMKAEADKARVALKSAQDNVRSTIKTVTNAGKNVGRMTGRDVIVEGADDIAAAYAKAAGDKAASIDPTEIHGFYDGKSYHINVDSDQAVAYTFGHEITHGFESLGKEYDDFVTALKDYVKEFGEKGEWDSELEYTSKIYKDVKGADPEKEAIANLVGKYMFQEDGKYLERLAKRNVPLFSRLYNLVKKLFKGADGEKTPQDAQLEALNKKMDDMFDTLSTEQKSIVKSQPDDLAMSFGGEASIERRLLDGDSPKAKQRKEWFEDAKNQLASAKNNFGDDYDEMVKIRKQIFNDTHWFQGYDGKWRYEMDDSRMKFKFATQIQDGWESGRLVFMDEKTGRISTAPKDVYESTLARIEELRNLAKPTKKEKTEMDSLRKELSKYLAMTDPDGVPLKEVFEHDEFFEMFPEAGDLRFKLVGSDATGIKEGKLDFSAGGLNLTTNTLELNPYLFSKNSTIAEYFKSKGTSVSREVKKTIIHELQHFAQLSDELAQGADPVKYMEKARRNLYPKNFEKDAKNLARLNDKKEDIIFDLEGIDEGEADAFVARYNELIDEEDAAADIDIFEDYDAFYGPEAKDEFVDEFYEKIISGEDKIEVLSDDFERLMKDYIATDFEAGRIAERDPHVIYRQAAGEREARDVADRLYNEDGKMKSSAQRKKEYPIQEGTEVRFSEYPTTGEALKKDAKGNLVATNIEKEFPNRLTKNSEGTVRIANDVPEKASEPSLSIGDNSRKRFPDNKSITPKSILDKSGNVSREADMAYGDAVKAGDMERAQKFVDAALESKGYTIDAYHGSDDFGFTRFDLGRMDDNISIFSAKSPDTAASYTKNAEVREVSSAKPFDEDAVEELREVLDQIDEGDEFAPIREGFDDWEMDRANGLDDARLEDYVEESVLYNKKYEPVDDGTPDIADDIRDLIKRVDAHLDNNGGVYHGKLKMDNPLVVEGAGDNWSMIHFEPTATKGTATSTTREVTKYAKDNGYDGVIFKDVYDPGKYADEHGGKGLNTWGKTDIYCVFDSNQFKSADAVTRNNDGDIIPLSERGNAAEPDIRFSMGENRRQRNVDAINGKSQKNTANADDPILREYTEKIIQERYGGTYAGKDAAAFLRRAKALQKKGRWSKEAAEELYERTLHPREVRTPKSEPKPEVASALKDSKAYTEYKEKPRAEQIKEQTPSLAEAKELLKRDSLSGYETSKHLETIYNAGHYEQKELRDQLEKDLKSGYYAKVKRESNADAIARAEKTVDGDWEKAYERQINKLDAEDLTAYDYAERKLVLNKLENMIRNGDGDKDALIAKHRALCIDEVLNVSNTGAALNASKIMKTLTPGGRAQLMLKKVEKLNKKFGDRLKGKELELTEDQYNRILKAESDEEAAKVLDEISQELMDQIPGTLFEKINELRRFTMLFNLRTHERNLIGNTMFWAARQMSDAMEVMAYKIPYVRKRLERLGGTVEMNKLSYRDMINKNKDFFNSEFDRIYKASGSKTQYRDIMQTGQPKAFKSKKINKMLDLNYDLLEKEDMLMFKPTFKKAYAQWCDARGITDLSQMTQKQMDMAGKYALQKAEYATFRDDSIFSKKIVGWKTTTQGKKGKTQVGTAAYRAANMALEGHLPFVKTPVNILRRSVDYSPVAVVRGMAKIAKADSPEMFKQAVHDFSSGLTGSGVAMLGALLYTQGHITVQAGNISGDAYYDRDMGYQDYSLVVTNPLNNKEYSVSIDWASPMQTSLFMGAAMQQKWEDDLGTAGWLDRFQDTADIAVKIFNPMLDMSFMQTSKDTFDTFMDRVYRNGTGDNADWTGAITQTVFGRIPQGYLGSLVPQLVSQAATGSDKYQRDTRSTNESAVAASWESWSRQIANKFPVLREKINNPKIDRFGNDKVNTGGNNIFMRFINAMANPSNVKRITTNEMDKELISIYNKIPESDKNKKFFFYSFTGNPEYELTDGRMNYKELYKYGKTKRQEQTDQIQNMLDSKSYKHMTNSMKVDEIDSYHFTSQTKADWKTYGAEYAIERIVGSKAFNGGTRVADDGRAGGKTDAQAWKVFKEVNGSGKGMAEKFVDFWVQKENLVARSHNTDYHVKALACALTGNPELGRAYDINLDKMKLASDYVKNKGKKKAYEQFTNACCNIAAGLEKAVVESTSKANRSWSAAGYNDIDEATYRAMGFDWDSAQSGAGLRNKYGYDVNTLIGMASDAKYEFDADKNGSLKKSEVMDYIESLGIKDKQHKACLFAYLDPQAKNPYDSIYDYLKWGDNIDDDSYDGWGRRRGRRGGRRRGYGGGGSGSGGGGGTPPKTASGAIKGKVTNPFGKVTNGSAKSNLDDAYRKKYAKLIAESRKKH